MRPPRLPSAAPVPPLALLAILAVGLSATGLPELAGARARLALLAAPLASPRIEELGEEELAAAAASLAAAAREGGLPAEEALALALPRRGSASALLATERDLADFRKAGEAGGRAGAAYLRMLDDAERLRPLLPRYETFLRSAWDELTDEAPRSLPLGPVARAGELLPTRAAELDSAHPFALDVFFARRTLRLGRERGPEILSAGPGIVVATADDWRGGAGLGSYRGGGFSPNSGNGVIVYDPGNRLFLSYFHLSEVYARPGRIVAAGTVLGRGGDTGSNARKPGHGGHLHLEAWDAAGGRALGAREILARLPR